jgi:hypothetical protein
VNCRCAPSNRCGKCDLPDIAQALLDWEAAERSELPNPRRDDEEWANRVRAVQAMNEGAAYVDTDED